MRLFLALIIFFLSSCETLFFQEYKIKNYKFPKKEDNLYYTVNKGDNLYSISKKYNVTISKLINFNNIDSPYKIFPNQKIFIPKKRTHVVERGDTLYSISRKYRTDVFTISRFNNLKNVNQIYTNQKLIIPDQFERKKKIVKNFKKNENKKVKRKITTKKKTYKNKPIKKIFNETFIWPVKGKILSKYGSNDPGFFNDGINIESVSGKDVKASSSGEIVYSGNEIPGYGNLILIKHSKNWITAYAHLNKIYKKKGTLVKKGESIGAIGNSGNVKIPQLHFEIRKGKEAVDPLKFLS
ncbi:MAG: hypothetical protein CMP38_04155 [Rickettsiales bacterium]|nr:hypothetical protein [Rickettsiales bacterium]|tara:strand:- start:864 stop:1751 length:888 start_codon:yes stop_codon:yes gene_type:complete